MLDSLSTSCYIEAELQNCKECMYSRDMLLKIKGLANQYPVITILGPRQAGKTTLAIAAFPDKPYVNLEELDIQEAAILDPRKFLSNYPDGAILDEIQRAPKLLSYIQVIVDKKDTKGLFILTGSHQVELHEAVSQSLAGRTALLNLFPMSLAEFEKNGISLTLDEALLNGGYPRIFKDKLNPTEAYRNYFQTYVERDLRNLKQIKDLSTFQKFVRLCAGRVGGILNAESLAGDVGVSSKTIKEWISILEASFILIRLQPYHENFGKRLIKAPKLYFTDVGLAAYLLGIETTTQLARDPLRGNLVENLVLLELFKSRLNKGKDPQLYYYRDSQGNEVDLIFQSGHELIPIEIKSGQTFTKEFLKNLTFFEKLTSPRSPQGYLIYAGPHEQMIGTVQIINYLKTATILP